MSTRWRKVLGDFREHRVQLGVIGLVLLLGTASVVAAMNAQAILAREIKASYARANSPDLALRYEQADPAALEEILGFQGVANADLRRVVTTQVLGRGGQWRALRLVIVRSFADQQLGLFHLHSGTWPANDAGLLIEQSSVTLLAGPQGGLLRIRTPGGGTAEVPFAGVVHDTALAPGFQEGMVYAYATPAVAARLSQGAHFDQIVVRLEEGGRGAIKLGAELSEWLATKNLKPLRVESLNNTHPHALLMSAMLRVLQTFALLAFIGSAALAAYVISLWLKREVRQIGIMKTLGARGPQLAGLYLGLVGPLVLASLVLALPLGMAGAQGIIRYYETMLNIDVSSTAVPRGLLLGEFVVALVLPLLAMAFPVLRAIRISAREAIQDPGITPLSGAGALAARLLNFPGNRLATFALRNTFRRPWRLTVSVLTLAVGGALLLTSRNNYESLMRVVDAELAKQGHDLEVFLQRPATAAQLAPLTRPVPSIAIIEPWRVAGVTLPPPEPAPAVAREPHRIQLYGHAAATRLLTLPLIAGRWPQPGETGAVVVNRNVQSLAPDAQVGGEFTVHFRTRKTTLRVVGLVEEIGSVAIYAHDATFESVTGLGDTFASLRIKAAPGTSPESVNATLTTALLDARLAPSLILSRADRREVLEEHFHVIVDISLMIAIASALVGGISLAAFATLNVIERTREIGVIRAIGATPRTVLTLFFVESGVVAGLSAVLAIAIGIGGTLFLNNMAARDLLRVAVPLYLSRVGHAALAAGMLVVLLGVWLTVRRNLRLSVRDALAYE